MMYFDFLLVKFVLLFTCIWLLISFRIFWRKAKPHIRLRLSNLTFIYFDSPYLLQLHSKFLEMVKEYPMRVITFAERESTYITSLKFEMRFVRDESADPDIGEVYGIPLDHLCICKPACRASFIYQKVLDLIQDVLDEVSPDKKSK